jgi:hypothetical protein
MENQDLGVDPLFLYDIMDFYRASNSRVRSAVEGAILRACLPVLQGQYSRVRSAVEGAVLRACLPVVPADNAAL